MTDPTKAFCAIRQSSKLYADREGLSADDAKYIARECGESLADKITKCLSDGILTKFEIDGLGLDAKSKELAELIGSDGTKPLKQRLQFFKEMISKDLKELSDSHPNEKWLQIAIVLEDGINLRFLPETAQDNENVVWTAIYNNPYALLYASDRLKRNPSIITYALGKNLSLLHYLGINTAEDKQAISDALSTAIEKTNPLPLGTATYVDSDRRAALVAIAKDHSLFPRLHKLIKDREFIFEAAHLDIHLLRHVPSGVLADPEFAIRLLKVSSNAFQYLPPDLQESPDFVLSALKAGVGASVLNRVNPKLTNNPEFAKKIVGADPWAYRDLPESIRENREIMIEAGSRNGYVINFSPKSARDYRDVALASVQSQGGSLQFFGESIKSDPVVVGLAIQNDGYAIKYADEKFRNDKAIALKAVQQTGMAFQHLSPRLREDNDIIQAALKSDPSIISGLSPEVYNMLIKDRSVQQLVFDHDFKLVRDPNDLSPPLKARHDRILEGVRKYNISTNKLRTAHIEAIIHNCSCPEEKDSRPLAIIFEPAWDHNMAFESTFPFELFETHRVVYHRVGTDDEMLKLFKAATRHRKVDKLLISGHGKPEGLVFGNSNHEGWLASNLDINDQDKLLEIERGLAKDGQVLFLSCSLFSPFVSESFGRMASRILHDRKLFGFYQPGSGFLYAFHIGTGDEPTGKFTHIVKCINGHCQIKD